MRGWVLKPSSVLITSMSAQSDGRTAQSGLGSLTRLKVFCVQSTWVNRSLGNGLVAGLEKSIRTLTPAASATHGAAIRAAVIAMRPMVQTSAGWAWKDSVWFGRVCIECLLRLLAWG